MSGAKNDAAPTDNQLAALKWLLNRNGDGVFGERSNHAVLLAGGDRAPVMRGTWSALERLGLVERYGPRDLRLRVTAAGRKVDVSRIKESA